MDVNGNYSAGRPLVGGNAPVSNSSRAVSVYHTGQDPTHVLTAPQQAIAIGTGAVAGFAWSKTTVLPSSADWVQVIP